VKRQQGNMSIGERGEEDATRQASVLLFSFHRYVQSFKRVYRRQTAS